MNTVCMPILLKRVTPFLSLIFLSSCAGKMKQESDFNAYLPPSSSIFEDSSPLPAEVNPTTTPSFWDLSDVDISYVQTDRKLLAFTFDDGPSKTMENILAVFADFNERNPDCMATATFFINGIHLTEENLPLLHTAHILGCELGNHAYRHLDLTTLSKTELDAEITSTDKLLFKVDGKTLHLFRPPFGHINGEIKAQLQTPIINWTIDTLDWTGECEENIYNCVFNARFSGGIVLMHDGYHATVNALKRLLPGLKADGYQVVSVSALAKAHGCTLYNGKEYIRARKQ